MRMNISIKWSVYDIAWAYCLGCTLWYPNLMWMDPLHPPQYHLLESPTRTPPPWRWTSTGGWCAEGSFDPGTRDGRWCSWHHQDSAGSLQSNTSLGNDFNLWNSSRNVQSFCTSLSIGWLHNNFEPLPTPCVVRGEDDAGPGGLGVELIGGLINI